MDEHKPSTSAKGKPPVPRMAFRIAEAAEAIGVSVPTIYRRIRDGEIRAKAAGSMTLITAADLQAYLDSLPDLREEPQAA